MLDKCHGSVGCGDGWGETVDKKLVQAVMKDHIPRPVVVSHNQDQEPSTTVGNID